MVKLPLAPLIVRLLRWFPLRLSGLPTPTPRKLAVGPPDPDPVVTVQLFRWQFAPFWSIILCVSLTPHFVFFLSFSTLIEGVPLFNAIFHHRELVWILVQRNLKIRYKHSALGFFWSLLTPLLMILMYAVFASILKFNTGDPLYLPFLVSGIVVWQFTAGCLNDSLSAISGSANLVKKVAFPRAILPVSTVLANAVNFALTFVVLIAYLFLVRALHLHAAYWLLAGFLMQLTLGTGIACLCSTSNVFFRDTQHIVGIGSLAWFFLSPVFYGLELQVGALHFAHPQWGGIIFLNPMSGILMAYRAGLMGLSPTPLTSTGTALHPAWIGLSAIVCLFILIAGATAIRSGERHFGDVL